MKLPRLLTFLFITTGCVLFLNACQKDIDQFVPDNGQPGGPDTTWYSTINSTMPVSALKNVLLLSPHVDSFQLSSTGMSVQTSSGLQCIFNPGSLSTAGSILTTGKIYIESLLLKKKGHMIRMGTPTVSNGHLLVSGGEIFMRLRTDSFDVHPLQNHPVSMHYDDQPVSTLMQYFRGEANTFGQFNWLPVFDSSNRVMVLQQAYEILSTQLNWINCDYFYDTSGIAQTILSTELPVHYTNANTIAYTVFNDMRSVADMYGNPNTKKFSSGKLPVNKQVTVVVISRQGNDYYLGHVPVTTMGNGTPLGSQQVPVTPVKTSLNDILAYLESL